MSNKIRPVMVVAVLVMSLAAIFGVQYIVKTYRFEEPFKERVLSIEGIEGVRLENGADVTKIYLTMGMEVDVQKSFQEVTEVVNEMMKGKTAIEIEDRASSVMAEFYRQMHYSIYEGIASGRFTAMAEELKVIAGENRLDDYTLQVDNGNVYLKLVKDGEVFIKVVPRSGEQVAYQNTLKGGESQW